MLSKFLLSLWSIFKVSTNWCTVGNMLFVIRIQAAELKLLILAAHTRTAHVKDLNFITIFPAVKNNLYEYECQSFHAKLLVELLYQNCFENF